MSVPIGTILPFAGPLNQIPQNNNFLPCDGRVLEIEHHRDLYNTIGNHWGGNAALGNFRIVAFRVSLADTGTVRTPSSGETHPGST